MNDDKKIEVELMGEELSELLKDLPRIIKLLSSDNVSASNPSKVGELDDVNKRKTMTKEEK